MFEGSLNAIFECFDSSKNYLTHTKGCLILIFFLNAKMYVIFFISIKKVSTIIADFQKKNFEKWV